MAHFYAGYEGSNLSFSLVLAASLFSCVGLDWGHVLTTVPPVRSDPDWPVGGLTGSQQQQKYTAAASFGLLTLLDETGRQSESCFLVSPSWVISHHNGDMFTLTASIGPWASKEGSHNKICAHVSYKELEYCGKCNSAVNPGALFELERRDLWTMCLYSLLCAVSQLVHYPRSIFTGCFYPSQSLNTAKKMGRGGVQTTAQVLCSVESEMTF